MASLDEMVDLTNIGTLFAFILVCAGTIILRVREPDRPRAFRVPGGWLVPVLGILACLYLVYYLPPTSWMRFASWLNLGLALYAVYGADHSRLTGRREGLPPGQHEARTAFLGATLALLGVALLWLTRGLDLWIAAWRAHGAPGSANRFGAVLADIARSGGWVEVSGFLLFPLAIHALVLGPFLARRAFLARRLAPEAADRDRATRALAMVLVLEAASLPYLAVAIARLSAWVGGS